MYSGLLPSYLDSLVQRALAEDVGSGDITTLAIVESEQRAIGRAIARAALVVCGEPIFSRVFYSIDPGLRVEALLDEGVWAKEGDVLWLVEGSASPILTGERTALNFAQRLSGIATLARRFVSELPDGASTRITDTRKTTPGLRALERYAVRCGGGHNHREHLGSAVLIKDNHIQLAGGVREAILRAQKNAPHTSRIEVEVESLRALDQALEAGADLVLLDNFEAGNIAEAVTRAAGRARVEVSGGVRLADVSSLARAGVDYISVGALTHSAPAADIALEVENLGS
jgi:nicotinate-nucleotide pyrophosphorylase (carboxylating)